MYGLSKKEMSRATQKFGASRIKDMAQATDILCAKYSEISEGVKNGYRGLMYSGVRKDFLKALTEEEIFMLHIPKDAVLSIFNIAFMRSIEENDMEIMREGICSYNRLRMYERIFSGHDEWCALAALSVNDNEALGACFPRDIKLLDAGDLCGPFLVSVRNLLRTILFRTDKKEEAIALAEKTAGAPGFDRGLMMSLAGIAERNVRRINESVECMLEFHPRCRWLHTEGYYGTGNLFRYFPVFAIGIYNLARTELKEEGEALILPEKYAWIAEFSDMCMRTADIHPFFRYPEKIDFMNACTERIGSIFPKKMKAVRDAWGR